MHKPIKILNKQKKSFLAAGMLYNIISTVVQIFYCSAKCIINIAHFYYPRVRVSALIDSYETSYVPARVYLKAAGRINLGCFSCGAESLRPACVPQIFGLILAVFRLFLTVFSPKNKKITQNVQIIPY